MIARLFGGYAPRHARPKRGRYRAGPVSSAGLYAWMVASLFAAVTVPGVIV